MNLNIKKTLHVLDQAFDFLAVLFLFLILNLFLILDKDPRASMPYLLLLAMNTLWCLLTHTITKRLTNSNKWSLLVTTPFVILSILITFDLFNACAHLVFNMSYLIFSVILFFS